MATIVRYNGVTLSNVITREFSQQPVRDESQTDQIGQKFVIRVETIVNLQALAHGFGVVGLVPAGSSAAAIHHQVRQALAQDRGDFEYEIDGYVLIRGGGTTDLNNGPRVIANHISHVTSQTLRIEFAIELFVLDSTDNLGAIPDVLNNRWSSADDIDEQFRTTRTWRGKLRIASSAMLNAHSFRFLCVPLLALGWRRTKMHFTVSPNGLELAYTITDQQMLGEAPPFPAAKWKFRHTESMLEEGINNTADFELRMEGAVRSNKWLMLEWALRVMNAKLALQLDVTRLTSLVIVDYGGDSVHAIEVRGHVVRTVTDKPLGATSLATIMRPISDFNLAKYDPDRAIVFGPYGTADAATLAGLFGCFLQTPYSSRRGVSQADKSSSPTPSQASSGSSSGSSSSSSSGSASQDNDDKATETTASEGEISDDKISSPQKAAEQTTAMYEHVRLQSRYEIDSGVIALPIADRYSETDERTVQFISLHRPTSLRRIQYQAERIGKWPILWKAESFSDENGIDYRLKSWSPTLQARTQLADGQVLHAVDAEYVFWMSRPLKPEEAFPVGTLPWDTFTASENEYPSSQLVDPDDSENGLV